MPDVLQRPLDSGVAPGGILFRHPHRQAPNLRQHSTTARTLSGVRPLPGDELPMPAQQRVRSHDGRDLPQPSTPQPVRSYGESAPIVIGQLQTSTPQLAAKHPIFFEQITKDLSLLAVQPPDEEREHQLESGGVDHRRSLYHGPHIVGRRASIQSWDITACSPSGRPKPIRHVEAGQPGDLLSLDTFYVGKLKGVGKVWQITGCDVASSFGWARLIVGEVTAAAVLGFLRETVRPTYRQAGWRLHPRTEIPCSERQGSSSEQNHGRSRSPLVQALQQLLHLAVRLFPISNQQ